MCEMASYRRLYSKLIHTSLGRSEVLSRSWSPGPGASSLLNAESTTLELLALESFLGGIGLFRGSHLDKAKTARFFGVRVAHDLALLDLAILLEETVDFGLSQFGMNAGDEQVRTGVHGTIVAVFRTAVIPRGASSALARWLWSGRGQGAGG